MYTTIEERNTSLTYLLNGTFSSLKNIVPINHEISKPELLDKALHLHYGVLIGITGDIKGKLVLAGNSNIFDAISESMYGMSLEGEMLASFSGELGNMIAGGLSTIIVENGINLDITSPTIMEGNTTLFGFENAINLVVTFKNVGKIDIYFLLD